MKQHQWLRVNKKHRCPYCVHADWCAYSLDAKIVLCMRKESQKPSRNGGWFHPLTETSINWPTFRIPKEIKKNDIDWNKILSTFDHDWKTVAQLADVLKVGTETLYFLEVGYSKEHKAWGFPMKNAHAKIIGVRLRNDAGKKWAIRGSRQGLFIPKDLHDSTMMICEGATDTAAALTLGYFAIGRASCECGGDMIKEFITLRKIKRVILIPDNDEAGLRGVEKLKLDVPFVQWIPPKKDLRSFLHAGGTREILESSLKDLVWNVHAR